MNELKVDGELVAELLARPLLRHKSESIHANFPDAALVQQECATPSECSKAVHNIAVSLGRFSEFWGDDFLRN